jgi:hypothetical protein
LCYTIIRKRETTNRIQEREVNTMTNYKVTIKTNNMILGYVVKDSIDTDNAMARAIRSAKFECGIQAEDILEVIVKPL